MAEKFGWCFIGTGTLANQVAKQILKSGKHDIVSCYTRNFEKCQAFAQTYGAKPYRTSLEAMKAEGVEGVYVVTPHNVPITVMLRKLLKQESQCCARKPLL